MDTLTSVQKKTTVQSLKSLITVIIELRGNGWKAPQAPPSNIVNPYANGPIFDEFGAGPAEVEAYESMNNQDVFYPPYYSNNFYTPPRYLQRPFLLSNSHYHSFLATTSVHAKMLMTRMFAVPSTISFGAVDSCSISSTRYLNDIKI